LLSILLLTDWFPPGYKAGGPITSCWNLSLLLSQKIKVYVLTSDRDLSDSDPYPDILPDIWIEVQKNLWVCYLSPSQQTIRGVNLQIQNINPKVIYLNSLYSLVYTIYPMWLKWQGRLNNRMILAPRGMLKDSALAYKSLKKRWFIRILHWGLIASWVDFHATDEKELLAIKNFFGRNAKIFLIPNNAVPIQAYRPKLITNSYHFLFVGRIHPIKGLKEALLFLRKIKHPLTFSIVGSNEVSSYWQECQGIIETLPSHIKVDYLGELPPIRLKKILETHHFLLLPTKGENFGHAIFEALAKGLPVIISNQTPWKELQELGIGWDISLDSSESFVAAIENAVNMPPCEYFAMSKAAWQYAKDFITNSRLQERYLEMFESPGENY